MKLSLLLHTIFLLSGMSCDMQKKSSSAIVGNEMLITATMNTYIDSCWNKGDVTHLKGISTENFNRNLNGIAVASNQNEMQAYMAVYFKGFPDLEVILDSTYVKGNTIFTYWRSTGTHTGMLGEIVATGKKVQVSGLSHLFFNSEGKLTQEDVVFNELQLLQQLGYTLTPPILE